MIGILQEIHDLLSETESLLLEGQDDQWDAPPYATSRDDTTERGSGGSPVNPTASIALDGRRLRLRAAVVKAERELTAVHTALGRQKYDLTRAIAGWKGL